jgi:glycosyltransferase involved in cell wall biosynthesis
MTARRILIAAPLVPGYDRESGSQRLWDFMDFLQADGYAITFFAQHGGQSERYSQALRQRGIETHVGQNVQVETLIREGGFDLAFFAFWPVAENLMATLRRVSPETRVIVDSVDLHFLRHARETFQRGGEDQSYMLGSAFAADLMRELNVYAAADAVLTVSEKEANIIADFTGDRSLAYCVPDCEDLERSPIPFEDRKGILFVGNFRHQPNIDAVTYLCNMVLPQLSPDLTNTHPTYVVGNALGKGWWTYSNVLSQVRLVGWVPSVRPYIERARVTVLPLLNGAGTKRKMLQTLMLGTPAVSTSFGIEGLDLVDGEHVVVADQAPAFARGVLRLLEDPALWNRIAARGHEHIRERHSRERARADLLRVLALVQERHPKPRERADVLRLHRRGFNHPYDQMTRHLQEIVRDSIPIDATVAVVSKGDEELLDLGGHRAWHFPRSSNGGYAGHYPAGSEEAIAHLEVLRGFGLDYLIFPEPALWWLDHYPDFAHHLDSVYQRVSEHSGACVVYAVRTRREAAQRASTAPDRADEMDATTEPTAMQPLEVVTSEIPPSLPESNGHSPAASVHTAGHGEITDPDHWTRIDAALPDAGREPALAAMVEGAGVIKVLVLGTYLASRPNHMEHIVENLASSTHADVVQRWVAFGGSPESRLVDSVTVGTLDKQPKFGVINEMLAADDLTQYDYVIIMDDDVRMPPRFVDYYLALQNRLEFALAQPARTIGSHMDLPIVAQQPGSLARQTLFVEIGPIFSVHRSIYDLIFPFDLISSMGWGYECLWSYQIAHQGLKMGIIDATPVDHTLRPQATSYSWNQADSGRSDMLATRDHYSLDKCFRVIDVVTPQEAATWLH